MNKLKLVAIENKGIYKEKSYTNSLNKKIDLSKSIENAIKNTSFYEDVKITNKVNNTSKFRVKDKIIHTGTIDCIISLRNQGETGNIVALNFASATTPGGGYLNGSTAQEESLCRASMLYPCLTKDMTMYKLNRENYSPIYSDRMIYSPYVPVIRNDDGKLLDAPLLASFITSPAVNRKVASKMFIKDRNIDKAMDARIRKILSLALENNPSVIVLGAFGCGVFGNKKEVVYKIFEDAINDLVPLESVKVVFAVREKCVKKIKKVR